MGTGQQVGAPLIGHISGVGAMAIGRVELAQATDPTGRFTRTSHDLTDPLGVHIGLSQHWQRRLWHGRALPQLR